MLNGALEAISQQYGLSTIAITGLELDVGRVRRKRVPVLARNLESAGEKRRASVSDKGKAARAAGVAQYCLAGRPTEAQFIEVYGPRGPRMTWAEREKMGVGAKDFQTALRSGADKRQSGARFDVILTFTLISPPRENNAFTAS